MVAFRLSSFGGMVPAVDDRLLPDNAATLAKNTWLYNGNISGFKAPRFIRNLVSSTAKRVFRIPIDPLEKTNFNNSVWLEFDDPTVTVIRAPMLQDSYSRYYWLGKDTNPTYNTLSRIQAGLAPLKLGVPEPAQAPSVRAQSGYILTAETGIVRTYRYPATLTYRKTNGTVNANTSGGVSVDTVAISTETAPVIVSRSYLYTYVTEYGEEGPPSPPSLKTGVPEDGWIITIPAVPSSVTNGRRIENFRLYRTITSSTGVATYYQVDEFPITQTSYTDTKLDTAISSNNQLESETWTEPPITLKGWVSMPNGIIAAFKDNEVWFCEPYRPHAWPVQYQVSVDYPIVGLGVMGQTLIIATTGTPWAATGVRPTSMSLAKINTFEPCQSRASIMSTPEAVMYASPNGLVAAVPGQVRVVTSDLINPDEWQSFHDLSKLQAVRFGTAYMAFETPSTGATSKGFLIEAGQPRISYNQLENLSAGITAIDTDPWSASTLIIRNGAIYVWDQPDNTNIQTYVWKSKVFQMPYLDNLGAMKIFFTVPSGVSAPFGVVRVYADGRLVLTRDLVTSGEEMRLPSGFTAHTYQVEVEARVIIHNIQVATTSRELRGV